MLASLKEKLPLVALVTLLATAVQGLVLYLFGQPVICLCGEVKFWEGVVASSGNSQHFTDWYTFSHIIHGFLFYALARILFPKASLWVRLSIALGIEVSWEILENTPWVIDLYRQQPLSMFYSGDSILNSLMDTLAMVGGFLLAWTLPVWGTVALALGMEFFVGYSIRDNLTLNVINFVHHFEWLRNWQGRP